MNVRGRSGERLRLLAWAVGTAVSIPVIAGYVALGATVLAGRTLVGVVRGMWRRVSGPVRRWDQEAETPTAA